MTIVNAEWHREHPMPQGATLHERIVWHAEHALACGCRDVPQSLRAAVKELTRKQARKRSKVSH